MNKFIKIKNLYLNTDEIISMQYTPAVKKEDIEVAHVDDDGVEWSPDGDVVKNYQSILIIRTSELVLDSIINNYTAPVASVNRNYKFSGEDADRIVHYFNNYADVWAI